MVPNCDQKPKKLTAKKITSGSSIHRRITASSGCIRGSCGSRSGSGSRSSRTRGSSSSDVLEKQIRTL